MIERLLFGLFEVALWSSATRQRNVRPVDRLTLPSPDALRASFRLPARLHYEPNATRFQKHKLEKLGGTNFALIDTLGRDQAAYLLDFFEVEAAARAQEVLRLEDDDRERNGRAVRAYTAGVVLALLVVFGCVCAYAYRDSARPPADAAPEPASPAVSVPSAAALAPTPDAAAQALTAAQFRQAVALSQARAVRDHPALGTPGSHFNTAFVARYQQLARANSPRLHDPRWPEALAAECAASVPAAFQ